MPQNLVDLSESSKIQSLRLLLQTQLVQTSLLLQKITENSGIYNGVTFSAWGPF